MRVIPVLDLKGGGVVRAVGGRREEYRPIATPLAPSNAPQDVAAGLLRLHPFSTLYVADLDAILGRGDNSGVVKALREKFPQVEFWLDAGATAQKTAPWTQVIGSESLAGDEPPPDLSGAESAVLSLDFKGEDFLGPLALLDRPSLWPRRVIVMTLARVGSGSGPDFSRLGAIKARAGAREVFAAGGVRDARDVSALAQRRIAGALVASALHDGAISSADLTQWR